MLEEKIKQSIFAYWLIILGILSVIWLGLFSWVQNRQFSETETRIIDNVSSKLSVVTANLELRSSEFVGLLGVIAHSRLLQNYANSNRPRDRDSLIENWLEVIGFFDGWKKIRFLDVEGWELAAVDYDKKNRRAIIPPQFQYQGAQDYFERATQLKDGEVVAIGFELEEEFGQPVEPYQRAHRLITPVVFDAKRFGYLVIYLDMHEILAELTANIDRRFLVESLDQEGYYLWTPKQDKAFGFSIEERGDRNLNQLHPQVAAAIKFSKSGSLRMKDQLFIHATFNVHMGRETTVPETLLVTLNDDNIQAQTGKEYRSERKALLWLGLILLLLSFPMAQSLQRRNQQRATELLALVASRAMAACTITDANGNIVFVNEAFTKSTGYSRDEVMGKTHNILKSGQHEDSFFEGFWRSLTNEGRWEGEMINKRKDGSLITEHLEVNAVRLRNSKQTTHYIANFIDISERKALEQELERLAVTDPLTNIYNRRYFDQALNNQLAICRRHPEKNLVFGLLDIDLFKHINDSYGHDVGDKVIQRVASTIKGEIREIDIVARLGGEEFAIILLDENQQSGAMVMERVRMLIASAKEEPNCRVSIGFTINQPDDTVTSIYRRADEALYTAKSTGRNKIVFR